MSSNINERVLYDSSVMLRRVAASLADMGFVGSDASNETPDGENGRSWKERTLLVTSNQRDTDSTGALMVVDP